VADKSFPFSVGGQITTTVASTGAADVVLVSGPGRMCKVIVTTGGTALLRFWDSATTSGDPAAAAVFTVAQTTTGSAPGLALDAQVPFVNGLVVTRVANGPGVTVTYNKDTAYGR